MKESRDRLWRVVLGFCRWTSVRGMPHVVRADHPVMSKVWCIFVVIMAIANIVLVALLFSRYYDGNTIENIKTERRTMLPFPSVTVCNVDPINTDRMYCLRNLSNDSRCGNLSQKFNFTLAAFTKAAKVTSNRASGAQDKTKISVFYQLIGREAAAAIGHQQDDLIVKEFCKVDYYNASGKSSFDGSLLTDQCSGVKLNVTPIITPQYFNCFTVTIDNPAITNYIRRLSMVLYLDEEEDLSCRPHCTHEVTEWSGAKAVVHPGNTYPEVDKQGLNLLPGASNQLLIKEVRQSGSLDVPNAPCESDATRRLQVDASLAPEGLGIYMNYTDDLCISLTHQKNVINHCGCIDSAAPVPTELRAKASNLPFCGNVSHPREDNFTQCSRNVKLNYEQNIYQTCKISCTKLEYFIELTQLRWPQKPQILNYYPKFKERVYYDRKLKVYEELEKRNQDNSSAMLQELLNVETFEKNFLQVDVIRANFDVIRYKENQEYTLTTFLSQIGGICSIFLGFTFVTVLELCELCYRIYVAVKYPEDNRDSNQNNSQVAGEKRRNECAMGMRTAEA